MDCHDLGSQQIQQKIAKPQSRPELRVAQLFESSSRRSDSREMFFRDRAEKRNDETDVDGFEKQLVAIDNDNNSDEHPTTICSKKDEFFADQNWKENFEIGSVII